MIAAHGRQGASMLRQPIPKRCLRAGYQGVSANAHDTLLDIRIGARFAWLKEEVNATVRPCHATIAL
jgi:hypothetical protein